MFRRGSKCPPKLKSFHFRSLMSLCGQHSYFLKMKHQAGYEVKIVMSMENLKSDSAMLEQPHTDTTF